MTLSELLRPREAKQPSRNDELHLLHSTFYERTAVLAMDYAFKDAMLRARRAGLENFTTGVVVDDSPLVPTHFTRESKFSLIQSTAAACADQ